MVITLQKYAGYMENSEFIALLDRIGWTDKEAAKRFGVTRHTISNWKKGKRPVHEAVMLYLELVCKLVNV